MVVMSFTVEHFHLSCSFSATKHSSNRMHMAAPKSGPHLLLRFIVFRANKVARIERNMSMCVARFDPQVTSEIRCRDTMVSQRAQRKQKYQEHQTVTAIGRSA